MVGTEKLSEVISISWPILQQGNILLVSCFLLVFAKILGNCRCMDLCVTDGDSFVLLFSTFSV